MSESIQKHPETLTDVEKRAVLNTLNEFRRFTQQSREPGTEQSGDSQIMGAYQSSLQHTENPRVALFITAGAAGSTRAGAREVITADFFRRVTEHEPRPEFRDRLDRFSRSAAQARQYPDGGEAIAVQGGNIVNECLSELANSQLSQNEKDVLLATIFYAAAEAGPGSPAEHMAQSNLPPLE